MLCVDEIKTLLEYDETTGKFKWLVNMSDKIKAGVSAGSPNKEGYIKIQIRRKKYSAHRLAWVLSYGKWPDKHLDHINQDKSDNRLLNLREATFVQNSINRAPPCTNTSGVMGVTYYKRLDVWVARLRHKDKQIYWELFPTKEAAIIARKAAEHKFYGEFATPILEIYNGQNV